MGIPGAEADQPPATEDNHVAPPPLQDPPCITSHHSRHCLDRKILEIIANYKTRHNRIKLSALAAEANLRKFQDLGALVRIDARASKARAARAALAAETMQRNCQDNETAVLCKARAIKARATRETTATAKQLRKFRQIKTILRTNVTLAKSVAAQMRVCFMKWEEIRTRLLR